MNRLHWVLGAVVLLGTGWIGLTLTAAQTKAPKGLPAADLRKVKAFQEKFGVLDKIIDLAKQAGETGESSEKGEGGWISDDSLLVGFASDKFVSTFKAKSPTTLKDLQVLKINVNRRLDDMIKKGHLTEIDRQLLEKKTVKDMAKLLHR